jgi:hypothetical protein
MTDKKSSNIIPNLRKRTQRFPNQIQHSSEEIREYAKIFNPIDLIASVRFSNVLNDPNSYEEPSHEGMAINVEYLSLVLAKDDFEAGTRWVLNNDKEYIEERIDEIVTKAQILDIVETRYRFRDEANEDLEELQLISRGYERAVRKEAYEPHRLEVLREMFEDMNERIRNKIGFDINDSIDIVQAIKNLDHDKLWDRLGIGDDSNRQNMDKGGSSNDASTELLVDPKLDSSELETENIVDISAPVETQGYPLLLYGLGDLITHTAYEISQASGVPPERTEAFLEAASIEFGEVDEEIYRPTGRHLLRKKPILHSERGYTAPVLGTLYDAIRGIVESEIKSHHSLWETYSQTRHDYVLEKSVSLISSSFPFSRKETELYYYVGENGNKRVELDGLIKYGNVLFLIEAKAGSFAESARKGRQLRLRDDLKTLIRKSYKQSLRAKEYIDDKEKVYFEREDGEEVQIDTKYITRTYLVTVTLETLGHLTSAINSQTNPDLIEDENFPWIISLYDLHVISDLAHVPVMIPHFIERRLRASRRGKSKALDELDFFGRYLHSGLYFSGNDEIDRIHIGSHTVDIDKYYMYEYGPRTEYSPKPEQDMPYLFEKIVQCISSSQKRYAIENALVLFDLDGESRSDYVKKIQRAIKRGRRKKNPMGVNLAFTDQENPYIIATYITSEGKTDRDLIRKRIGILSNSHGIPQIYYTYLVIREESCNVIIADIFDNILAR